MADALPPLARPAARPPVSWRSVGLGLLGVCTICGLTPYNDYVLDNTFLVGNNLPIGVVMLTVLFVLLVNAPLHRWAPRHAVTAGEMAVALTMTLVSCGLPSSGLMRYFPPVLVAPFYHAINDRPFLDLLGQMRLPTWIYPSFVGDAPEQWASDPIVIGYVNRWVDATAYPYLAWVRPAIVWGVFFAALYTSLLCFVALVRRQWVENERLAFPLAQIHLALIEQPPPGRALNAIFRNRLFWFGFTAVFALHVWNGLGRYFPKHYPVIPVYYDVLYRIMSNPPWSYVTGDFKGAAVFFTAVGITYFLSNSVAFSLWFFFVAMQGVRMIAGSSTGDPNQYNLAGSVDQQFGGVVAFAATLLWVGRRHWQLVVAQAFRGHKGSEPRGRYLSFRASFWGMVGGLLVMVVWLWVAGCTLLGAAVMVAMLFLLFVVITRVIAESGLMHGQLQVPINHPWVLSAVYGHPLVSPLKTFYFASMLQDTYFDFREVVPVYASHGMRVVDAAAFGGGDTDADTPAARRAGRRVMAAVALALLVGYLVSFAATLHMEYKYSYTLDTPGHQPNKWGVMDVTRSKLVDATERYAKGSYHPPTSPAGNFAAGFALTAALAALRLRFALWPLHPIGYLMVYTYPGTHLWLSVFFGWLAKNLILRFGGTRSYTRAKPFFLGLIVGESMAAGLWLVVGVVLSAAGLPYHAVNIMPG